MSVDDPGTLSWQALYRNHTLGYVATTAALCPAFQESLNGHCRPDWLVFGQGTRTVTGP